MTIGELLTAFPWIAFVEVDVPCGVDEQGETDYEVGYKRTLIAKDPELPAEIAAREILECAVMKVEDEFGGETARLLIWTR